MVSYAFQLHGCTENNLAVVKSALANISGVTCSVNRSARGSLVAFVHTELGKSEAKALINNALAHLEVNVGEEEKPSEENR